jgi:hypothetical protein
MYIQKVISRKTFKKLVFCVGTLNVEDENSRIRIQDPLVRDMDRWTRIRIHTKMSWIRNTENLHFFFFLVLNFNICSFYIP